MNYWKKKEMMSLAFSFHKENGSNKNNIEQISKKYMYHKLCNKVFECVVNLLLKGQLYLKFI